MRDCRSRRHPWIVGRRGDYCTPKVTVRRSAEDYVGHGDALLSRSAPWMGLGTVAGHPGANGGIGQSVHRMP